MCKNYELEEGHVEISEEETLTGVNVSDEIINIRKFMADASNSHECHDCPYNDGYDEWPGCRLPCGQFTCWVDVHQEGGDE